MNIIDWQIMSCGLKNEINNGIILYGASLTGKRIALLLDELNLSNKVLAVIDSDKKKWGKKWMNYIIDNPKVIENYPESAIIVITSVYLKEIVENLQNYFKCMQRVCSFFSFRHALHYDIYNDTYDYIEKEKVELYKNKYVLWRDNQVFINETAQKKVYYDIINNIVRSPEIILLCSISKVGNETLIKSFNEEERTDVSFTRHSLYYNKATLNKTKDIIKNFSNHKIKIISGVREPIERIISLKWQVISFLYLHDDKCISTLIDDKSPNYINNWELYENLNGAKFNSSNYCYPYINDWFRDHIEKVFDIDIFEYPFDKEKGYSIVEKNNVSIFIYRLDKLNKLENEIKKFSCDSNFKLKSTNIASDKKYVFAYKEYLKDVKVKKTFFDNLVNSKSMTHFYTEKECMDYRKKWKDKLI